MSDECKSEWERRKAFIRNGFPMPHCGGKRYTMPDDIAEELKVRAAIEQVEGTVFERAAVEIERLRELSGDAGKLREERDEARRLYINEMCLRDYGDTSARIREANARGWNCFDSDGWSDPGDECQREAL